MIKCPGIKDSSAEANSTTNLLVSLIIRSGLGLNFSAVAWYSWGVGVKSAPFSLFILVANQLRPYSFW